MSQLVDAEITCPNCGKEFDFTLFRSIWGERPDNRELVMSDKINVATCPACKNSIKLEFSFIYTNSRDFFAVWWEPNYDPQIEIDSAGYTQMLGVGNYLAEAPRIKDWTEFKNTILKFENGELKGKAGVIGKDMSDKMEGIFKSLLDENSKKQRKGCFGILASLLLVLSCSIIYALINLI